MKTKKKILIAVSALSLLLHGVGIYLLCELTVVGGMRGFAKNPFHFQLKGIAKEQLGEITCLETILNRESAVQEKSLLAPEALLFSTDKGATSSEQKLPIAEIKPLAQMLDTIALPPADTIASDILNTIELDTTALGTMDRVDFGDFCFEGQERITESDHFTYQVEYAPRRYRAGYVFKITLYPKSDVAFKRMRQNFFFLVDRSNSIPRGRYFLNKKAICAILPLLHKEDRFNILIFDDKAVRLSNELLECTSENIEKAQNFLENLGHGGYFSSTDIYASLGKILPRLVSDTEINTAILLSDGDTYLTLENQRLLIRNWSQANDGKVTLFCFASGTGNNLTLLETIAAFNKGAFVYVADHNQIEERLKTLILSLRHPIGKEMAVAGLSMNRDAKPHLLPKTGRLPDLYQHRPYVIYGVINRLEDFTLFLQGKFYNRPFDIRKKISFSQARFGSLDLERKYTSLLAQDYFEQFFKDGKMAHLEAAKRLLAPLDMAAPFLR